MRFDPFVTRTAGETCRLLVQADARVTSLRIANNFFKVRGELLDPVVLFDDGTHGDARAGDHLYTVDQVSFDYATDPFFAGLPLIQTQISIARAFVTYVDGSLETVELAYPLVIKQIRNESYLKPSITTLAGAQKSDYSLALVVPFTPGFPEPDTEVAKRYYALLPDDRDFLVLSDELPRSTVPFSGYSASVRNKERGYGSALHDDGALYGSAARLQQLIRTYGPNAGLLNHELLHRWGVFLFELGLSNGAHWMPILRPSSGFGSFWGAFHDFTPLGGATYRAAFNDDRFVFNDLELYLMGLLGPEAVAWPVKYLKNPQQLASGYDATGRRYTDFTADGIADLTLANLVNAYGERSPASPAAQKQFQLGMVVLYDRLLSEVELAWFDMFAREYGRPSSSWRGFAGFESATGGIGRMGTLLTPAGPTARLLLPSSANAAGLNGAFYRTDVSVANTGAIDTSLVLKFLGHGSSGSGGAERDRALWAGRTATYDDVLDSVFQRANDYGALQASSSRPVVMSGETYTQGFGGTFGQSVPAARPTDLVAAGSARSIAGVREDAAFRTNLVLCNAGSERTAADVALRDADGALIGQKSYPLDPLEMIQVSRVVRDLGVSAAVQSARLVLSTSTPGGSFAAYASAIDNATNDPRTLLPSGGAVEGAGTWLLGSSAHGPGANGAFYTTDLTVANLEAAEVSFTVKFLGHDEDGTAGPEKTFSLGAGKSVTYLDVLESVFGRSAGYGALRISSASRSLAVAGQTSTPGFGGTFGQSVPSVSTDELVRAGALRTILAVRETAAFRTNLILANAAGFALDVDVALLDGDSTTLAVKRYRLPPLGMTQVTRVVRDLGIAGELRNARLVLSTPTAGGSFAAYASAIDNVTNDPRTLLAR